MSNQQRQASQNPQQKGVFISYSHSDKKYLNELKRHLTYFERNGIVSYWDDTKILAGTTWEEEIEQAIQAAKVAVLLVSADFFASNFIARAELPFLIKAADQRTVRLLIVIVRPCHFGGTELEKFQTINPPSQPLSSLKRDKREEVWVRLVKYIQDFL